MLDPRSNYWGPGPPGPPLPTPMFKGIARRRPGGTGFRILPLVFKLNKHIFKRISFAFLPPFSM